MGIFLIFATFLFLIFGILLLLAPKTVADLSSLTNRVVFAADDKIHAWRRPIAIMFLSLAIFCWYVALS